MHNPTKNKCLVYIPPLPPYATGVWGQVLSADGNCIEILTLARGAHVMHSVPHSPGVVNVTPFKQVKPHILLTPPSDYVQHAKELNFIFDSLFKNFESHFSRVAVSPNAPQEVNFHLSDEVFIIVN